VNKPARLDLDGVVVVAGAGGGGIGTAVCRLVARAGAAVVALDNRPPALDAVREALSETPGPHQYKVADVRDAAQVERALDDVADLGPLSGLVHVAGGTRPEQWAALLDLTLETFDEVLELNLRAALVTMKTVVARLVTQRTGGSIVVVSSVAASAAMPYAAPYAAAKAGLVSLVRSAALEWGPHDIRVNSVAPGTVRTPKNAVEGVGDGPDSDAERAVLPLGRRGLPDDVAGVVLFLLSSLSGWMTGQVLAVDGGSSVRPSFLGADNLPVFVHDPSLRARLTGHAGA
jgi:3-oxoacyl-[acyl-carrier protein] reductase